MRSVCTVCGIVGATGGADPSARSARRLAVEAAMPRLGHRGPDADGVRHFDHCSLGHTRLRILDLSPLGDQPMGNGDGTVTVAFNGEIYNFRQLRRELEGAGHRFRSGTDTEVLLHLYEDHGTALTERLRGMFAFAIWDEPRRRLVLVRDRLGIKPLYYRRGPGGEVDFASEARVLVRPGDRLDLRSLGAYLRLGWVPGPRTLWHGISELPPGHVLTVDATGIRMSGYWSRAVPGKASAEAGADDEELADALAEAAALHLEADVPIGIFLSSGVDSAAIASLVAKVQPSARTFTVAGNWADESEPAAAVARRLGLDHTIVRIEDREVRNGLDRFFAALDQPTVDGLNTWVISRAVRNAGLVAALSGLGGDELFGGYSTFRHVPRLVRLGRAGRLVPAAAGAAVDQVLGRLPRAAHSRGRRALAAGFDGGWNEAYAAVRGLFGRRELERLWPASRDVDLGQSVAPPVVNGSAAATVGDLEVGNYLPYQLLRDTDVMSMAHSLEVRVPLLDDRVAALALGRRRAGRPWTKADMAAAASPDLADLVVKPKQTFTLPIGAWMRGPLRADALSALIELGEADLGFDRRALTELWDAHDEGRTGWRGVWALVVLSRWVGDGAGAGAVVAA